MAVKLDKAKKVVKAIKIKKPLKPKFIYAIGRRRSATARVRLHPNQKGSLLINEKPVEKYFPGEILKKIYLEPLRICNVIDKYLITVRVAGSGRIGQLGAVVHGISRVLLKLDREKFHSILKKRGLLTRDSRTRERRKIGMGGKARRKKQSPRR